MSDYAIRISGVGKLYKLFSTRSDNLRDAIGLTRFRRRRAQPYREFWALRGIDLELERGKRVGIIGRNGAGKTTLLKLITGNFPPTEGEIEVNGVVHALMDAGAGFHPEFTGIENIRASLEYQGFNRQSIRDAIDDIAEFTELGDYLGQPLKTYSLGMYARLAFATATAVRPDVLVVDEILGAGDAYFVAKSVERIEALTHGGTSMLIVSHSMGQITQLCSEAIWLDRGRVVEQGPSLDVVRSYEGHIRELDDRRIQEKNRKRLSGTDASRLEDPELSLVVEIRVTGPQDAPVDVSQVVLVRDSRRAETIEVGAPQDVEPSLGAFVRLEGSSWSAPERIGGRYARRLTPHNGTPASGLLVFDLLHLNNSTRYELDIEYRKPPGASVAVATLHDGPASEIGNLDEVGEGWQRSRLRVPLKTQSDGEIEQAALSHWPGEGSLRITDVVLTNAAGQPCAVFEPGDDLSVTIHFEAAETNTYELLPALVLYRMDGINISTQIGTWTSLSLGPGHSYRATTILRNLNLGNGSYVASPVLYKEFDQYLLAEPVIYDWIDRGIEFQVVGTPPAITSVFQHPSSWTIDED